MECGTRLARRLGNEVSLASYSMCIGLALALAEFAPEAGTCLGQLAAPAVALRVHGEGIASSPQQRPQPHEGVTQAIWHHPVLFWRLA